MMTWHAYAIQKAVLLACLAGVTTAGAHPKPIPRKYSAVHRALFLSNDPASKVPELYVAGQVVTTLRFEQPCNRERTKMMGWEGRFEPVECVGKKVLIERQQSMQSRQVNRCLLSFGDGRPASLQAKPDVLPSLLICHHSTSPTMVTRSHLRSTGMGGAHRATSYGMPSIYCLDSCLFSDLAGVNAKRRALECTRIMQPSFWLLPSRHAWVSVAQAPVFPYDRTEAPDRRSVRTKLLRP
ncbi:MAG TPA: DUF2381 family protein [Archangium sp.]|nr:DUF2381 family protein [Archangium sp.]